MGVFEMVVAIVLICVIGGVVRSRHSHNARLGTIEDDNGKALLARGPDTEKMRSEMKTLKERVAVLERIATDKSNRLEREIEALREDN